MKYTFELARNAALLALILMVLSMAVGSKRVLAGGVVGSGTPASCTESALATALSGGGAIVFNCGSAPVTISLTTQKQIAADTTIDGEGLVTLSASGVSHFQVFFGHSLTLKNITIANGSGTAAGALENFGTTILSSVLLTNNHSTSNAGAVFNQGTLTVTNSSLAGNQAASRGGALYNDGGTVIVTNTLFVNNSLTTSTGNGGAIYNSSGSVRIYQSTLTGNTAPGNGGAIYNTGDANLINVTLSGNHAPNGGGGGVYQGAGTGVLNFVTVADNTSLFAGGVYGDSSGGGDLSLANTLLSNNAVGNCGGVLNSGGYNLSSDTYCGGVFTVLGDLNNTPASIGPLANNGGNTPTYMLLASSPAVNAGHCIHSDLVEPVRTDQRGVARPQGSACDIGAVERQAGDAGYLLNLPLVIR